MIKFKISQFHNAGWICLKFTHHRNDKINIYGIKIRLPKYKPFIKPFFDHDINNIKYLNLK